MNIRAARVKNALWGFVVGDVAGVPYEFREASEIPKDVPIGFTLSPPVAFIPSHPRAHAGAWSDDSAAMLATLDALVGTFPSSGRQPHPYEFLPAVVNRLLAWRYEGKFTPDGLVFDVGNQTAQSLEDWRSGALTFSNFERRGAHFQTNGNGSLMRALPLAIFGHREPDLTRVVAGAEALSALTHPHPLSCTACALYTLAVRHILDGREVEAFECARNDLGRVVGEARAARFFRSLPREPSGTGFVLDSLVFAMRAVTERWSYVDTIRRALRFGNDTDTTAAIAGGLVGMIDPHIPSGWKSSVYDPKSYIPFATQSAADRFI